MISGGDDVIARDAEMAASDDIPPLPASSRILAPRHQPHGVRRHVCRHHLRRRPNAGAGYHNGR